MKKLCLILFILLLTPFAPQDVFAKSTGDTVQILLQVMEKYYPIKITLLDKNKQPIMGAKITLYSSPITKYTDENGTVVFDNVPQGEHRIVVEKDGQIGEQKLILSGQAESFNFNITFSPSIFNAGPVAELEKVIALKSLFEKAPPAIQIIMIAFLWLSSVVASVMIALFIRTKRRG